MKARLVIRGGLIVDGTGGPPYRSDILVQDGRITAIQILPKSFSESKDTQVIDAQGKYILPGFVDLHGHIRDNAPPEYIYRLWLLHGVTTVRDPASHTGLKFGLNERARSRSGSVDAPDLYIYARSDVDYLDLIRREGYAGIPAALSTPALAREYARSLARIGADGIKSYGDYPDVYRALLDEAKKVGLGVATHLAQDKSSQINSLQMAEWGVTTIEHWYGTGEALLPTPDKHRYPADYILDDEPARFGDVPWLWDQTAEVGSGVWNDVLDRMVRAGVILDPTFSVYQIFLDPERASHLPWFKDYALPALTKIWDDPNEHQAVQYSWDSVRAAGWRRMYAKWRRFVNDFKNRGGLVTVGTDAGYGYSLYGFTYIQELEQLEEAGFTPLEAIRSATMYGAEAIMRPKGKPADFGVIRTGFQADLLVVNGNPLADLNLLYATGALRIDPKTGAKSVQRGLEYTISNGKVYRAERLRQSVLDDVRRAKN